MSQAGIINLIDNNPTIPIYFEADTGFAVALFNVININGTGGITTSANGNTIVIDGSGISPGIETLTGNDAIVVSPISGNIDILTVNTSVKVQGSSGTLTLDFNNQNLLMGTPTLPVLGAGGNVGYGASALNAINSNTNCSALGAGALQMSQADSDTTAIGWQSLANQNGASFNTAVGSSSMQTLTTGSQNTSVGYGTLANLVDGISNTAMGFQALILSNSNFNTTFGNQSYQNLADGMQNTGLGHGVCMNLLHGSNNTVLGVNAGLAFVDSESNNLIFGSQGVEGDNNVIRIGQQGSSTNQQNECFIAGIVGVTLSNALPVFIDSTSGQLGVGNANSIPQNIFSASVDFTSASVTPIFTSTGNFLITNLFIYSTDISGVSTSAACNFGWTSSNFDDFISGGSNTNTATGQFINMEAVGNTYPVVPVGETFSINVTLPDSTATTNIGTIILQGMYV